MLSPFFSPLPVCVYIHSPRCFGHGATSDEEMPWCGRQQQLIKPSPTVHLSHLSACLLTIGSKLPQFTQTSLEMTSCLHTSCYHLPPPVNSMQSLESHADTLLLCCSLTERLCALLLDSPLQMPSLSVYFFIVFCHES